MYFSYENVRLTKEIRNEANRRSNCDQANIDKTVAAAEKQIISIQSIQKRAGLDSLSDKLREVAEIRLAHPDASLAELGDMGKTGKNFVTLITIITAVIILLITGALLSCAIPGIIPTANADSQTASEKADMARQKIVKQTALKPYAIISDMEKNEVDFGQRPWEEKAKKQKAEHERNVAKQCDARQKKLAEIAAAKKKRMEEIRADERSLVNMEVPKVNDYKTWMSYKSVTAKGSMQYALLNSDRAKTDKNGFRKIGNYYCVALGSYYSDEIGTRFKITFADGKQIKVVLGDQKSDKDTDKKHQYSGTANILEFIMGGNDASNQLMINNMFPGQIVKIEKYTRAKDMF